MLWSLEELQAVRDSAVQQAYRKKLSSDAFKVWKIPVGLEVWLQVLKTFLQIWKNSSNAPLQNLIHPSQWESNSENFIKNHSSATAAI